MSLKNYITPEGYITSDLCRETKYASIKNAYDRNDLSVIVRGSCWYTEGCPERIFRTVYREMRRLFPDLVYMYD